MLLAGGAAGSSAAQCQTDAVTAEQLEYFVRDGRRYVRPYHFDFQARPPRPPRPVPLPFRQHSLCGG